MRRSQVYCGEIILEMLPVIYDAPRVVTIDRANKKEQLLINQEFTDRKGDKKHFDMATGKFSCTISLGTYASKRKEAVQTLSEIAKGVPQVALPLLPLILSQMDSPLSDEAAAIVQRMLPPALQAAGSPEQLQAQLQQAAGMAHP